MKIKIHYMIICIIAILAFACAPSPENVSHFNQADNFNIVIGFWHGLIAPFSLIGKLLGLDIGLYDAGKSMFSYWVGYGAAIYQYLRYGFFFGNQLWQQHEVK
ncbi:hypothetical protein [Maribellus sp. YY47]|uniref:hypothetical protein n=1 Tax=Maribellus sp. YY47 TaxID=2929486 RepID=UPI0020015F3A|nr:hypothetical protein [Maribellus sp. YY47]MCK3683973.1 hypothetical protein [Maribellus sp. YY47]